MLFHHSLWDSEKEEVFGSIPGSRVRLANLFCLVKVHSVVNRFVYSLRLDRRLQPHTVAGRCLATTVSDKPRSNKIKGINKRLMLFISI